MVYRWNSKIVSSIRSVASNKIGLDKGNKQLLTHEKRIISNNIYKQIRFRVKYTISNGIYLFFCIRFAYVRLLLINVFTDQKTQEKLRWAVAYFVNNQFHRFHAQAIEITCSMCINAKTQFIGENSLSKEQNRLVYVYILSISLNNLTSITIRMRW